MPLNLDTPKEVNLETIHFLLGTSNLFNYTVDAKAGLLVRDLMASSYLYRKGKLKLPEDPNSYVQDSRYLQALLPDWYQRIGVVDLYLVRKDGTGKITAVVPEYPGNTNKATNLLKIAQPGDVIIGHWWF